MDRVAAVALLSSEYQELVAETKLTTEQTSSAYNNAVDMALRQLGYAETDLATAAPSQSIPYIALLNYYALKRFVRLLSPRFDVNIAGSLQASRSQAFSHVRGLLEDAETECINLGFTLGGKIGFQMGRVELDFNEPGFLPEVDYGYFF